MRSSRGSLLERLSTNVLKSRGRDSAGGWASPASEVDNEGPRKLLVAKQGLYHGVGGNRKLYFERRNAILGLEGTVAQAGKRHDAFR